MAARDLEKVQPLEVEVASSNGCQRSEPEVPKGDYSGAITKTDKAEIDLVKKLDRRILPILWAMYFLYVLSRQPVALRC